MRAAYATGRITSKYRLRGLATSFVAGFPYWRAEDLIVYRGARAFQLRSELDPKRRHFCKQILNAGLGCAT